MDNDVCDEYNDGVQIVSKRLSQREYVKRQIEYQTNKGIDDPLIVGDIDEIVERYKRWCRLFPRVKPFYSYKCNNDPVVVSVLASLGCGFDCASKAEIQHVLDLGVEPSRIVYANPCKQASHITYARQHDVHLMTFDSDEELIKIRNLYPSAQLLLRFRPDHNIAVGIKLGTKFGYATGNVRRLLVSAKKQDLNVVGVSFHVGGNCQDAHAYHLSIQQSRAIFDVGQEVGFHMNVLDIGGGFRGRDYDPPSLEGESATINQSLDRYFPAVDGLDVIAEPGRYFVESAFSSGACVIGRKVLYEHNQSAIRSVMYTITDGIYGSLHWTSRGSDTLVVSPVTEQQERKEYLSVIWGPALDQLDCVTTDCTLPLMDVGEWVHVSYTGAYGVSLRTNFNGMPRPRMYYFTSKDVRLTLDKIPLKGPKN